MSAESIRHHHQMRNIDGGAYGLQLHRPIGAAAISQSQPRGRISKAMTTTSPLGPLFDLQLGKYLKRAGMGLALNNAGADFTEQACALIREVHSGQTILAETWRQTCLEHGVSPHHPNAWGALTSTLRARGIIRDTGTYATAQSVKNHGHTYRRWQVTPTSEQCSRPQPGTPCPNHQD